MNKYIYRFTVFNEVYTIFKLPRLYNDHSGE